MPPKNQKKGGKSPKVDEDDAILAQYAAAAPKEVAPTKHSKEAEAAASRQASKQKLEEAQRLKSQAAEKQIEQRLQQQRFQALLRAIAESRESLPVTTIESASDESSSALCAHAGMQGWRPSMEDAYVMLPAFDRQVATMLPSGVQRDASSIDVVDLSTASGLYAVFDGHGGDQASKKCAAALPALVASSIGQYFATPAAERQASPEGLRAHHVDGKDLASDGGAGSILHQAYRRLDDALKSKLTDGSGATAVTVVVTTNHVVCASVGDSRALLVRKDGVVVPLAFDHKPEDPQEKARIEAAGGFVQDNRVNGRLAMSRAVGDHEYKQDALRDFDKQLVICVPDVRVAPLKDASGTALYDFLVVACDGIFDVLSNDEVGAFVREQTRGRPLTKELLLDASKAFCNHCLAPKNPAGGGPARAAGSDNMTILVVALR